MTTTKEQTINKLMFEVCKGEYFCELEDKELQTLIDEPEKHLDCQDYLNDLEGLNYDPVLLTEHEEKPISEVLDSMHYLAKSIYEFINQEK